MATQEDIQKLADLVYLSQNTGVPSNKLNEAYEAVGISSSNVSAYVEANKLLRESGYAVGNNEDFYKNSTSGPSDIGAQILYERWQEAPTEEELEAAGLDPNEYKVINSNAANGFYLEEQLRQRGIDSSQTNATKASTAGYFKGDKSPFGPEYQGAQNVEDVRKGWESYGVEDEPNLDIFEWDLIKKKAEAATAGGSGNNATGITTGGTATDSGAGGISGGFTQDAETLDIPDSAVLPTFNNGVSQVSPGASGTYTVPAQTFEDNITNQVEDFKERAVEQQQFYQPQTIQEKEAAGQDVSSYAISQKLYRNPNTGHQIFIPFQGDQPLQAIPAGYYEVNQSTGAFGQQAGIFNPITAGGNTFTGANSGGMIQGFNEGSMPIDPNQIYGNVSFTDPVTGQVITQTPAEYMQSLGNKQAQATFNPATSVAMPGVSIMTEATSPGTVLESTAGQAQALAPVVTGEQIAQVGDVVQAKGPGTPAIYDDAGNLVSAAVDIPGAAQVGLTTAAPGVSTQLEGLTAATSAGPTQAITGQTQDTSSVSGLTAATGQAQTVADVAGADGLPTRTLQDQELITGTGVDQAAVQQAFGTGEVAAASVQDELAGLMAQFEGGDTPAWAAGSMRRASQMLAARGLGASSMAGQAVIQAAMEAALPIAQIDAGNKQQMALFKAEQRAKFLGMEFDQAFQAKVQNAARVSEVANMNFSAEQQIALENSRAANTMDLQNLSNQQALIMSEAAALSQLDMANLSNLQQAQVQNAQNFLQIDMANLSNTQSTALFKAQQVTNAMLSDAAQANASAQFNATSQNQTNQFFSNLAAQVSQFNAAQQNAINQFNAEEANAVLEFNSALQNQREMFNAQNYLAVAQANAQWRQNINTANTEAQNVANLTYAKEVNGLTQKALDDYWQKERDIMSYAFAQSEGAADRALRILLGEQSLTGIREQLEFKENEAKSAFWSDLLFGDASFSDIFSIGDDDE